MYVTARIEEIELENDQGRPIQSVRTRCSRCQYATESFGRSDASIKRCLALLRSECPEMEQNFYTTEELDE